MSPGVGTRSSSDSALARRAIFTHVVMVVEQQLTPQHPHCVQL